MAAHTPLVNEGDADADADSHMGQGLGRDTTVRNGRSACGNCGTKAVERIAGPSKALQGS